MCPAHRRVTSGVAVDTGDELMRWCYHCKKAHELGAFADSVIGLSRKLATCERGRAARRAAFAKKAADGARAALEGPPDGFGALGGFGGGFGDAHSGDGPRTAGTAGTDPSSQTELLTADETTGRATVKREEPAGFADGAKIVPALRAGSGHGYRIKSEAETLAAVASARARGRPKRQQDLLDANPSCSGSPAYEKSVSGSRGSFRAEPAFQDIGNAPVPNQTPSGMASGTAAPGHWPLRAFEEVAFEVSTRAAPAELIGDKHSVFEQMAGFVSRAVLSDTADPYGEADPIANANPWTSDGSGSAVVADQFLRSNEPMDADAGARRRTTAARARRMPCGARAPTSSWASARCSPCSTRTKPRRRSSRRSLKTEASFCRATRKRLQAGAGSTRSRRPSSPARRGSSARRAPGSGPEPARFRIRAAAADFRTRTRRRWRARCLPAARSAAGPRRSPRTPTCAWARGGSGTKASDRRIRAKRDAPIPSSSPSTLRRADSRDSGSRRSRATSPSLPSQRWAIILSSAACAAASACTSSGRARGPSPPSCLAAWTPRGSRRRVWRLAPRAHPGSFPASCTCRCSRPASPPRAHVCQGAPRGRPGGARRAGRARPRRRRAARLARAGGRPALPAARGFVGPAAFERFLHDLGALLESHWRSLLYTPAGARRRRHNRGFYGVVAGAAFPRCAPRWRTSSRTSTRRNSSRRTRFLPTASFPKTSVFSAEETVFSRRRRLLRAARNTRNDGGNETWRIEL